jgi:hypothetical protein
MQADLPAVSVVRIGSVMFACVNVCLLLRPKDRASEVCHVLACRRRCKSGVPTSRRIVFRRLKKGTPAFLVPS